ncbi:MAG: sensor histidine kinase [bacterium]
MKSLGQDNFQSLDEEKNKFLEISLWQSQNMEALGVLACGIAHDFNNILTAMIGYTELSLAQVPADSHIKQNLWEILQAGRRAKELVNQILKFRRENEQENKVLPIVPLIKEVYRLLQVSAPPNIKVNLQIEDESQLIRANPTQIYQILMNLCMNAIQAIGDKEGMLQIKLSSWHVNEVMAAQCPDLNPGPYVCLSVEDTGVGMTPEVMSRIFDPYFTTKKNGEGNGLGLAIVQGLVKRHNGAIFVYSEPGKGSIFQVFLPTIESRDIDGQK